MSTPNGWPGSCAPYYERVPLEDLAERDPRDLYGAAMSHWATGGHRELGGPPSVRVYNPDVDSNGWESPHTVVEIVCDDRPFLVDSMSMALHRRGWGIHLVIHPILLVERTTTGDLVGVGGDCRESWLLFEVDRQAHPEQSSAVVTELHHVLQQIRASVDDWPVMREKARWLAADLASEPAAILPREREAARELLQWMADDHFTFLGYREYQLGHADGTEVLRGVPGTGLGVLREGGQAPSLRRLSELPDEVRARIHEPNLLIVTKANSRSTIHRPDYLEYIGVKIIDEQGVVTGERHFIGLYTALAYRASAMDIPFLRGKIDAVLDRSGLSLDSHDGRELWNILETFPRDDLFQISVDELLEISTGILNLQERKQVRLFARRDEYGRFWSCLVYVPRDRYSATVVVRMEDILLRAYGGTTAEHTTLITESVLARVHFLVYTGRDAPVDIDTAAVERQLVAVTRWWIDDLRDALVSSEGEQEGLALLARYGEAFPASYREGYDPRGAVKDIRRFESLDQVDGIASALYRPVDATPGELRFKLYVEGAPISLSSVLPLLEHLGMQVTDERPYELRLDDGRRRWLYDFGLRAPAGAALDTPEARQEFRSTFAGLYRHEIEPDGFNRLVLAGGLTGRQVTVLRAYAKYLRQAGTTFSQRYIESAMAVAPGHRQEADRAVLPPLRPGPPEHPRRECGRSRDRARPRPRRRGQPRRGPHLAFRPAPHRGDDAHQRVQHRRQRCSSPLAELQVRPGQDPRPAPAAPDVRDLGVRTGRRGRAPAGWPGGTRRHPLERSHGGLPHRDPRADEGPDGQERGDRPRRRQGRVRGEGAAR